MSKMQHQFWVTKKCVLRKLGSKEDECVVASDAELDAKLELFRSVSESCVQLQRIIDMFQERLCILAQEENALGRYLKESGKAERNVEVGKAMNSAGKAIAYVGHQRLALRPPLVRLHHEVETFRNRAITDSRLTVGAMEKSRTEYRAALGWMKSASAQLDPEAGGLNNFRKAQSQVRTSKANFDRLTLACLQKVDLLAAARCNMFSHALVLYENAVVNFASKAGQALGSAIGKIQIDSNIEPISIVPKEDAQNTQDDEQLFFNADYTDNELVSVDANNETKDTASNLLMGLEDDKNIQDMSDTTGDFLPSQLLLKQTENKSLDPVPKRTTPPNQSDRAAWFDLFSELDPLSNPDKLTGTHNEHAPA